MAGGAGKGVEEQTSEAADRLISLAEGFNAEVSPLRQEFINQLFTVLSSGSVGGQYAPELVGTGGGGAPSTTAAPTTTSAQAGSGGATDAAAKARTSPFHPDNARDLYAQYGPNWAQKVGISGAFVQPAVDAGVVASGQSTPDQTPSSPASGGSTALVPIVNRALEASLRAGSEATRATEEDLARSDLLSTPFGQNILASTKREGALASSQVPTNFAMQFLNMIPGFVTGQGGQVVSGLSAAVPGNVTNKASQAGTGFRIK